MLAPHTACELPVQTMRDGASVDALRRFHRISVIVPLGSVLWQLNEGHRYVF
jgi:hypothetical protein